MWRQKDSSLGCTQDPPASAFPSYAPQAGKEVTGRGELDQTANAAVGAEEEKPKQRSGSLQVHPLLTTRLCARNAKYRSDSSGVCTKPRCLAMVCRLNTSCSSDLFCGICLNLFVPSCCCRSRVSSDRDSRRKNM